MAEKIIVVTNDQDIYFFDKEESLYEFLNEEGEYEAEDEDDRRDWEVLSEFPTSGREGSYCPFTAWESDGAGQLWPNNSVVVLWNGRIVHLKKHTVTREVKGFAYGPTPQSRGAKTRQAKKQSSLIPSKKAAKKRRGRPRRVASNE